MNSFETIESLFRHVRNTTNMVEKPIETNGFSASEFYLFGNQFLIKKINTKLDCLSVRTRDTGREYHLLEDQMIDKLFQVFNNPYHAISKENETYALMMTNLNDAFNHKISFENMFEIYLKSMAKMHSMYWNDTSLDLPYMLSLEDYLKMLGPKQLDLEFDQRINNLINSGWNKAEHLVPKNLLDYINQHSLIVKRFSHLPKTFIHGDYRPSNIAYNQENKEITLIDFAFSGYAPCTVDLFWFIATTTHLGCDYNDAIKLYRSFLEAEIGKLNDALWDDLISLGIIVACTMQLWEKALDSDENPSDLSNWIERLDSAVK